jgi:ATP/maltotriose-dependent transcriptional regulator MalT
MSDSILLQTKFLVPKLSNSHLERPHLVKRICQTEDAQRVLLIAPAGYGKTTLLTEVAAEYDYPLVWIQLDNSDNDPATFMAYLVAGLGRQLSEAAYIKDLGTNNKIVPERLLIILLNHLLEQPELQWMLVLDDYHLIHNPAVHQLVTTLFDNLPPAMRVVIASRITPVLPLARWRARKQLLELRAEQLRFSAEETHEWLQQYHQDLPEALIQDLISKTEGWSAGLHLATALISEQAEQDTTALIEQISGTQPYIFDYLMDEVFARQSETMQSFLLRSSVFSELNPEICAAVLGIEHSHEILRTLEKDNLFITRLDNRQQWYRYHQLFRDFLLSKFKTQYANDYRAIETAVGHFYAEQGDAERAIAHFMAVGDTEQVAKMLSIFAETYLAQGRFAEFQGYFNNLDADLRRNYPKLLLIQGRVLRYSGQLGIALARLQDVVNLTRANKPRIACQALTQLAAIAHSQGHYEDAYQYTRDAVAIGENLDETLHVPALMQMARCAGFVLGMDEGRQIAEQAFEIMKHVPQYFSDYRQARLLQELGQICWWHGDGQMAIRYCRQALSLLDDPASPLKARILVIQSIPILYQQDYNSALQSAEQALSICQDLQLQEILPAAYAALGNVLTRIGELERAESALRQAIQIAQSIGGARYTEVMAAGYLAQNLALQGRMDEARQSAERALVPYHHQANVYEVYVCRSVLADLLLDVNQLEQAKSIFEVLIELGEKQQYRIPLAMAYFGLAYILMREEQQEQALQYSQQSLALLEPTHMPQLYLDQHQRALVVCDALYKLMPNNEFLEQVYTMLASQNPKSMTLVIEPVQSTLITVKTLGAFRVFRNGQEIEPKAFASAKARDLLAYFLTFRHKSIPIDRAMEALWADGSGSHSAFHTALYRMRGALRQAKETEKYILSEMGDYRLDSARFSLDVDQFNSFLKRTRGTTPDNASTYYEAALHLYEGEYLDSLYYDWLLLEREKLQRDYVTAAREYASLKESSDMFDEGIYWLQKAIEYDPYQEALHVDKMRLLHRIGDRQKLTQHYLQLKAMLQDAFGSEPMPETQAAYKNLIRG